MASAVEGLKQFRSILAFAPRGCINIFHTMFSYAVSNSRCQTTVSSAEIPVVFYRLSPYDVMVGTVVWPANYIFLLLDSVKGNEGETSTTLVFCPLFGLRPGI